MKEGRRRKKIRREWKNGNTKEGWKGRREERVGLGKKNEREGKNGEGKNRRECRERMMETTEEERIRGVRLYLREEEAKV